MGRFQARNRWRGLHAAPAGTLVLASAWSRGQTQTAVRNAQQEFLKKLVAVAEERTHDVVRYDPAYVRIPYPGGDVPADTGVCTDEIIRSYRAAGVDLQKEVHEDMEQNLPAYLRKRRWLSGQSDTNIDHRRVPNLMVFFTRKGETLGITKRAEDYLPGDVVIWDLGGGVPHIGIVVDQIPLLRANMGWAFGKGVAPPMALFRRAAYGRRLPEGGCFPGLASPN